MRYGTDDDDDRLKLHVLTMIDQKECVISRWDSNFD